MSGGKLYLTTAVGKAGTPVSLHALCLNVADGKVIWDTDIFQPDNALVAAMHGKNSLASPTPILTADRLYVHFGHMGTAALDLSGKIIWKQNSIKYPPTHGNGGSPVLVDNMLIFNCDGGPTPSVYALDAASGEIKWKTVRTTTAHKTFSFCTPLVIDSNGVKQLISPGSGYVAAYDPADGHEFWRVRYGEGYSVVPRPIFAQGLLVLSSGFDSPILYAIKPEGAKGDVTDTNVPYTIRKGAPCTPSTLVVGDELYFVSDIGVASCADLKTGTIHWTHRLGGGFSASPLFADGKIYFQNEAGTGFVIKPGKTYEQLAENDLGERSLASYAVGDDALFIRTDEHLWKIVAPK